MTDADTTAAIEALAHRMRTRDAAMNDGDDYADADVFALEFITALRGQGWRLTAAKAQAAWKRPDSYSKTPDWHDRAAEARELLLHRNDPQDGAA